jgi:anti-sigma B factor antagonist
MDFKESRDGAVNVLAPVGSLDTQSSPELEERLDRLMAEARREPSALPPALVLSFREVDFVSSAGLRVLLRLAKRMDRHQGRLALCALNENVQQAFDICGFTRHFTIARSLSEAVQQISVPAAAVPAAAPQPSEADVALEEAQRLVGRCLAGDDATYDAYRARVTQAAAPLEGALVEELTALLAH